MEKFDDEEVTLNNFKQNPNAYSSIKLCDLVAVLIDSLNKLTT